MSEPSPILRKIERFLDRHGMAARTFGVEAVSDPNFVSDLREGREPRRKTIERAESFMARAKAAA